MSYVILSVISLSLSYVIRHASRVTRHSYNYASYLKTSHITTLHTHHASPHLTHFTHTSLHYTHITHRSLHYTHTTHKCDYTHITHHYITHAHHTSLHHARITHTHHNVTPTSPHMPLYYARITTHSPASSAPRPFCRTNSQTCTKVTH